MDRLLIISNNPLSSTNNNGKTLLSFIEGNEDIHVAQLFFSNEVPTVPSYEYYRITDKDVIKGRFNRSQRGNAIVACSSVESETSNRNTRRIRRNTATLTLRDFLWLNSWKSESLLKWLDSFQPQAVLFVAGDTLFTYGICNYIVERYAARLTVYVTDDYIMPRSRESLAHSIRRRRIRRKMAEIVRKASVFYTVSGVMQKEYSRIFNRDCLVAVNMSPDLKNDIHEMHNGTLTMTYTGSFYYGRSDVLGRLASAVREYNDQATGRKVFLKMYSNTQPSEDILNKISVEGASKYLGSLNSEQLKNELNAADVLVFVESLEKKQIEKTKYSLSTKVPEYLSVGKPILAIGPKEVGSIDYLSDVALCVSDLELLKMAIADLSDEEFRTTIAEKAREKYLLKHNKEALQIEFLSNVLGSIDEDSMI